MAYLGNPAANRFAAAKSSTKFSGNGSAVDFTLDHSVGSPEDILVSVDGVVQEPTIAYGIVTGTTLRFTSAPSSNSGNNIFVYYLFTTVATVTHPATSSLSATSGTFSSNATVAGTLGVTGVPTFAARSVHSSGITVANAGQIGSVGDADSMAIASNGVVTFSQIPVFSAGGGGLDPDGAVTLNESGADVDFRVESDIKTHAFFMEGSNGRIVINAADATGQASHMTLLFESAAYSAFAGRMTDNGSGAGFLICRKSDGATIGQVKRNGTSDAVQYVTTSDYRLKENVNYSWDGTTELKKLKPCRYNWINDESNDLYEGFLAHEVQSVVPCAASGDKDAVDTDGNIEPQGIDQSLLVPLLVKTIQELEARITALEG